MLECLTAGRGRNELAQQLAALELSQAWGEVAVQGLVSPLLSTAAGSSAATDHYNSLELFNFNIDTAKNTQYSEKVYERFGRAWGGLVSPLLSTAAG